MRILYVEDNDLVREVTCELLAQTQRSICACDSAEQALGKFNEECFDILITDVSLPVMSGIELVRSILRIKPQMPIIIVSGYALDFGLESWGANVHAIIKPFDPDEMEMLISRLAAH